jgi:predicted RND superfamily exporter protein
MAIVIIGGLITSTFLSLLVIPVVFTYVDDIRAWVVRLPARFSRHGQAGQATDPGKSR